MPTLALCSKASRCHRPTPRRIAPILTQQAIHADGTHRVGVCPCRRLRLKGIRRALPRPMTDGKAQMSSRQLAAALGHGRCLLGRSWRSDNPRGSWGLRDVHHTNVRNPARAAPFIHESRFDEPFSAARYRTSPHLRRRFTRNACSRMRRVRRCGHSRRLPMVRPRAAAWGGTLARPTAGSRCFTAAPSPARARSSTSNPRSKWVARRLARLGGRAR